MSKELENIRKAIEKYMNKHNDNVQFVGSFMGFKGKDFEIIDDIIFAYGTKKSLKIDLKETLKMIEKEKGDFVNW